MWQIPRPQKALLEPTKRCGIYDILEIIIWMRHIPAINVISNAEKVLSYQTKLRNFWMAPIMRNDK